MAMSDEQKRLLAAGRERARAARVAAVEVVEPIPTMPGLEGEDWAPDDPADPVAQEDNPPTPYELFLASLSDETKELLDEKELREAFEAATREASAERRKRLKEAAVAKAKDQARAVAGLLPAEELAQRQWQADMNRKVRWTPIMPFVSDTQGIADIGPLLDGKRLFHGQEVVTTYGQYLSARDILWNARQVELNFKGEGRLSSLRRDISGRAAPFNVGA